MAYSYRNSRGETYYLQEKRNIGRGKAGKIYFFSKQTGEHTLDDLPEGYRVVENQRTGLPVIKKEGRE